MVLAMGMPPSSKVDFENAADLCISKVDARESLARGTLRHGRGIVGVALHEPPRRDVFVRYSIAVRLHFVARPVVTCPTLRSHATKQLIDSLPAQTSSKGRAVKPAVLKPHAELHRRKQKQGRTMYRQKPPSNMYSYKQSLSTSAS